MKAGDLVAHVDRARRVYNMPGVVLRTHASRAGETLVDVYWTETGRTICAYTPNELRAFDESR